MATDSAQAAAVPAAGWYADPAGSGGLRWWDGRSWTAALQRAVAPPPAPPAPVAQPVVAQPVAQPAVAPAPVGYPPAGYAPPQPSPYEGDPRFGGPGAVPTTLTRPMPGPAHVAHAQPRPSLGEYGPRLLAAGIAVVVLLAAVLLVKGLVGAATSARSAGDDGGVDSGAAQGNVNVVAMKSDVLSVANAEETAFTQHQAYAPAASAGTHVGVGSQVLRLSAAGENLRVVIDREGVAYCVLASRAPRGGGAAQTVVYISSKGGLQSAAVRGCPSSF
jgi:hypothetical protein